MALKWRSRNLVNLSEPAISAKASALSFKNGKQNLKENNVLPFHLVRPAYRVRSHLLQFLFLFACLATYSQPNSSSYQHVDAMVRSEGGQNISDKDSLVHFVKVNFQREEDRVRAF